jgi:hypothetical protein
VPLVHRLQRPVRQHAGIKLIVLPVDLVEPSLLLCQVEGMATTRGRSMEWRASPVSLSIGRVSRSFDGQLEVVPVDVDLT